MTTPDVEAAVELLRSEIDGYRVASEIERGVMWSLAPYVDEFRDRNRADTPSTPLLTRLVGEASSSRSNEERMERLAKATETILASHAALVERVAALEEPEKALREPVSASPAEAGLDGQAARVRTSTGGPR